MVASHGVGRKPGDGRRMQHIEADASAAHSFRRGSVIFCLLAGAWGFRLRLRLRRDRSRLATLACFRLRQGYAEIKRPHRSPAVRAYPCLLSYVPDGDSSSAVVPTANCSTNSDFPLMFKLLNAHSALANHASGASTSTSRARVAPEGAEMIPCSSIMSMILAARL